MTRLLKLIPTWTFGIFAAIAGFGVSEFFQKFEIAKRPSDGIGVAVAVAMIFLLYRFANRTSR
ncbi:hypothetical protein [Novosphingobium sp. BW1]|uniref:hypothetical protein n=1 Tax=Novosphingobium sp. BW1 TaxID=2592621 RepID=UPI0011DEA2DD|nr:hypothetical protein [Novosphingobium sp. BW1]TYC96874.1 hypothetical protein FMM79_00415 [Novosphingobium sp. BW1]